MLQTLYVRDFALIDELSVSFAPGLTIITGETGAGKSILMGALNMVLGERASTELVRSGAAKAVIEATFTEDHFPSIANMLVGAGIENSPDLILRRDISASGQSRCFINDTPCTLTLLRQVGQQLVDLHGQHEHQLLLHAETHAELLDGFAATTEELARYRKEHGQLRQLQKNATELLEKAAALKEKRDFIEYQYKELEEAGLVEGEEAAIEDEINLLENAETLFSLGSELQQRLYDSEPSAYSALCSSVHLLEKLVAIDKRFEPHLEDLRGTTASVEEVNRFIGRYTSGIEFNRDRLEELRQRQMLLQRLSKKHGKSIDGLIALRDQFSDQLAFEENIAEQTAILEKEIALARVGLRDRALELSGKRKEAALRLADEISSELGHLGIPHSSFEVSFALDDSPAGEIELDGLSYRAFDNGLDRIEFMISTNLGEAPKPLAKVASGGEISRIMLALKSALARSADLPILVFDEIDTGISGKVAQSVGFSLKRLCRLHQIIAITHLPQIAAMGDSHMAVVKRIEGERTVTGVATLDGADRVHEVARLISGTTVSPSSLQLAGELIDAGNSV
ncbi:MAG: DNA repair protein RecN [Chlorobiaceae bacterium]|nr:DNA repair protein RecN [Chlorobiaceae bacterium]